MGKATVSAHEVRRRILEVVEDQGSELVSAYYNSGSGFAGSMFDSFGANPSGEFTSDDFVAASLLDVRFGPAAVQALLIDQRANPLLSKIPNDEHVALWNTELARDSAPWQLWDLLVGIDGVGATRASKLMARKRPHLMPILDSVVKQHLGLGKRDQWKVLGEALDDETRRTIDGLRDAALGHAVSTLRLLDVVAWMRFSESDRARAIQRHLGFVVNARS